MTIRRREVWLSWDGDCHRRASSDLFNVTMMVIPPTETLQDRGSLPPTCRLRTYTPSRNVPFRMHDKLWSVVRGKGKGIYCGVLHHLALKRIDERRCNGAHCSIDPRWICVLRNTTAALRWRKSSLHRMKDVTYRLDKRFGEDNNLFLLEGFRFRSLGPFCRRANLLTDLPRFVRNNILWFNTLRTGLLNCLNARSRGLTFRHRASSI